MKKSLISCLVLSIFSCLFFSTGTYATVCVPSSSSMTSLYGDVDWANGAWSGVDQAFDWSKLSLLDPVVGADITDKWLIVYSRDNVTWSQQGFPPDFSIDSAVVEISHGGWGVNGSPSLFFGDSEIGRLSVGENFSRLDTFQLGGGDFLNLAQDVLGFSFRVPPGSWGDGGVIDYVKVVACSRVNVDESSGSKWMIILGAVLVLGVSAYITPKGEMC